MLLDDGFFINIFVFHVMNIGPNTNLLPKQWYTSSDTHVNVKVIVAFEYLFSLYKIWGMRLLIQSSTIESGAWHMNASTTDRQIFEGKVLVFWDDFSNKTLYDGYGPALMDLRLSEILKGVSVPSKLIEKVAFLFVILLFWKRTGDAFFVAIIKVLVDVIFL